MNSLSSKTEDNQPENIMNAHIIAFLTSKVVANGIMADQATDPVSYSARKAITEVWVERLIAEVQ